MIEMLGLTMIHGTESQHTIKLVETRSTIDTIIQRATSNVIDFCSARPMSGNGSNMLLTGVRGIGKTTLMKGLCWILGKLQGAKLICVYHDYEIGDKSLAS
jgi:signal recognition particle GTPase